MPTKCLTLLAAAVTSLTFAGCDSGHTLDTFKFKGAMKAGEVVQESDLVPISIPWSKTSNRVTIWSISCWSDATFTRGISGTSTFASV